MVTAAPEPINGMIAATLKGAHIALMRRRDGVQVANKPDGSFVSSGDYQSQQIIEAELSKISPAVAASLGVDSIDFLMEESLDGTKHDFAKRLKGAHWVVDPIDGTIGYKQKHGDNPPKPWAVSIALEKDGETIAAVVYEAAPSEYATKDFDKITPNTPQGKIFWAHRDAPHAQRLEGGFSVTPANDAVSYRQRTRPEDGLLTLEEPLPELTVDFSRATSTTLTKNIRIDRTHPFVDGFFQDGQTRNTAQQTTYKADFLKRCGLGQGDYQDCYSAVAGAMAAADGRTSAFLAGRCFPWDASAARLILEKSGTPFMEYSIPGAGAERTMLIAGRDPATITRMKDTVGKMQDDQGRAIVGQPVGTTRRGFLGTVAALGATVLGTFGLQGDSTAPRTATAADTPSAPPVINPTVIDRLPGNVPELEKLSDEQKILLAACTASGCDAVAYYTHNEQGSYSQTQRITMYPPEYYTGGTEKPTFAESIAGYQMNTHSGEAELRANKHYHIPVYATERDGSATNQIKGIIVLHAPTHEFSQLQASSSDDKNDMREPVASRLAKLKMAGDIVAEHQDLFGATGELLRKREEHHRTIDNKIIYFTKLVADTKATLTTDSEQLSHMDGVTDLMDIAVGSVVAKGSKQAQLIHALTELHDVGKIQMSSAYMRPWVKEKTAEIQKYFDGENHNHPLFTLLELLLYPTDAKTTSAHHHGIFRYDNEQLKAKLGVDMGKYTILADNMKLQDVSPLSRLMRVCDVTEAITGTRTDKPIHVAMQELADKVKIQGDKGEIAPNSIDPDYLCYAIQDGLFKKYGELRGAEWKDKSGVGKYDAAQVETTGAAILERFGWNQQKHEAVKAALQHDPLIVENSQRSIIAR